MRLFGKNSNSSTASIYTLYYTSDIHGSDQCWRKFLGAARHYRADALIMGGDLTGKAIVPVAKRADGTHEATLLGERREARSHEEFEKLLDAARFNGMYPWVTTEREAARVGDSAEAQNALFEQIINAEITRWVRLADERLPELGADAFVMAGNDDPWEIDDALKSGRHLHFCDDMVVRVGDR